MADVTVKYKGNTIAEMSAAGTKTLNTSGLYCEDDIEVSYTPNAQSVQNVRTYEITLAKSSGWVLLTTLDAEVLEHINDASLVVSLANVSGYAYEWYSGSMYICSNTQWGYQGSYPAYGVATVESSETTSQTTHIYYPANYTGTDIGIGGRGSFRIDGNKYYFKAGDGFIRAGTYRLTFTW